MGKLLGSPKMMKRTQIALTGWNIIGYAKVSDLIIPAKHKAASLAGTHKNNKTNPILEDA